MTHPLILIDQHPECCNGTRVCFAKYRNLQVIGYTGVSNISGVPYESSFQLRNMTAPNTVVSHMSSVKTFPSSSVLHGCL